MPLGEGVEQFIALERAAQRRWAIRKNEKCRVFHFGTRCNPALIKGFGGSVQGTIKTKEPVFFCNRG
jgi:hypothetical protein